ncbi:MAG TPA: thioredoxin-like domain-containing protein [Sphingobacteriaceae bacterium]|nr:thioredoxin-like domain-containing protein [Sphingobacteriaceae bacterium]
MKYLLIPILLLLTYPSYSQYNYHLKAFAPKELNNAKAYLRVWDYYSDNVYKILDSVFIDQRGYFTFTGQIRKPCEKAILYIKKDGIEKFYLQFVIDSGLNNMVINKINTDYYQNKFQNVKFINSRSNLIDIRLDSLREAFVRLHGVIRRDSSKYISKEKSDELKRLQIEILRKYPNDYYSLIILRVFLGAAGHSLTPIFEAFNTLNDKIKLSELGIELNTIVLNELKAIHSSKMGNSVPVFSVKTDKEIYFNNKTIEGRPYIIAFSATWCIPCKIYEEKLKSLYEKYRPNGLEIVYFNLDDNVQKWKNHIVRNNLTWINVSEQTKFEKSEIAKKFHVQSLPLYILVDKKGTITYNADEIKDMDYIHLEKYIQGAIQ